MIEAALKTGQFTINQLFTMEKTLKLYFISVPEKTGYFAGSVNDVPTTKAANYIKEGKAIDLQYQPRIDFAPKDPTEQFRNFERAYNSERSKISSLKSDYDRASEVAARLRLKTGNESSQEHKHFSLLAELRENEKIMADLEEKILEHNMVAFKLHLDMLEAKKLFVSAQVDLIKPEVEQLHQKFEEVVEYNEKVKSKFSEIKENIGRAFFTKAPFITSWRGANTIIDTTAKQRSELVENVKAPVIQAINERINNLLLNTINEETRMKQLKAAKETGKYNSVEEASKRELARMIKRDKEYEKKSEAFWEKVKKGQV